MDDFTEQLNDLLYLYADNVTDEVKAAGTEVAKEAVRKLKAESPKRTGKYSRGWKYKKVFENASEQRIKVYDTKYQLTHLLEKGHKSRNGGMVKARKHIAPVEQWVQEEFEKRVRETVQNDS